MTLQYQYKDEQISDRLAEYGLPADVIYALMSSVRQQRNLFDEALRIAECIRSHASAIAHCARFNYLFSTEDLAVAADDLARISGQIQISRNTVEHMLTITQHLIGDQGHEFTMEISAMIWS